MTVVCRRTAIAECAGYREGAAMFIIFGWGHTTTHVFGPVLPLLCPNCHNEQFWILQRIRRWFTLFFIPVFPYESAHVLLCPVCAVGREMTGVELKRAKLFAEAHGAYEAGTLREPEYSARIEAIAEASEDDIKKGLVYDRGASALPAGSAADSKAIDTDEPGWDVELSADALSSLESTAQLEAASDENQSLATYCHGCGRAFDGATDAFCPKCGIARRQIAQ